MYDPDENDYERLQNQWSPEDPGILMEELYGNFDINQTDQQNNQDEEYDDPENLPAIPTYESWEECQAKTKRDPFLKAVKSHYKTIANQDLKKKYEEFIKEYDTPIKYYVPFFTNDNLDKVWKDKNGVMHSAFYCPDISLYDLYQLDPKLLIIYAPFLIKRQGFPDWYNLFVDNYKDKDNLYLNFIRENCARLKLNEIETKIIQDSNEANNHEANDYDDYYDHDYDNSSYWWHNGKEYYINEDGHLEET